MDAGELPKSFSMSQISNRNGNNVAITSGIANSESCATVDTTCEDAEATTCKNKSMESKNTMVNETKKSCQNIVNECKKITFSNDEIRDSKQLDQPLDIIIDVETKTDDGNLIWNI